MSSMKIFALVFAVIMLLLRSTVCYDQSCAPGGAICDTELPCCEGECDYHGTGECPMYYFK